MYDVPTYEYKVILCNKVHEYIQNRFSLYGDYN